MPAPGKGSMLANRDRPLLHEERLATVGVFLVPLLLLAMIVWLIPSSSPDADAPPPCQARSVEGVPVTNPCPMSQSVQSAAATCGIPQSMVGPSLGSELLASGSILPYELQGLPAGWVVYVEPFAIRDQASGLVSPDMEFWTAGPPTTRTGERRFLRCPDNRFLAIP